MRNVRLSLPLIHTTLWHSDYECNADAGQILSHRRKPPMNAQTSLKSLIEMELFLSSATCKY